MNPKYIYIGAPKAGSTWIYEFLKWHPDCFVPTIKDIYFFDKEYDRGMGWYQGFFEGAENYQASIDISHDYIFTESVAEKIKRHLPNVKIIACFRNPIEKEFSAYLFGRRNGKNNFSFQEGIETGVLKPERCLYAAYLKPYLELFGEENIKVMLYDDLKADAECFARDLCEFMQLPFREGYAFDKVVLPASKPRARWLASLVKDLAMLARRFGAQQMVGYIKSSGMARTLLYKPFDQGEKPVISAEMYAYLADYFRDDVLELQQIINRDLTNWLRR